MKAISLSFHRNGVAGESFYQFVYKHKEQGMAKTMIFVATFTTKNECTPEECIDWTTCRVTSVDDPDLAWRGDRIADEIEKYLFRTYGKPKGTPEDYFWHLMVRANSKYQITV